jgi:hypothetical protein
LETTASNGVGRARVLGHVERIFVPHVDNGGADFDSARSRADGREERKWRPELAREMVHPKVRTVRAQLLCGDRQLDRLEQ